MPCSSRSLHAIDQGGELLYFRSRGSQIWRTVRDASKSDGNKDFETIQSPVLHRRRRKAIGEGSINYISYPQACAGIKQLTPNAKIVFILRQPVDRAFSSYQQSSDDFPDPAGSFEAAWRDDERRAKESWYNGRYRVMGLYYEQLKVWFDTFDRRQIRVYLYEDLRDDPSALMRDLYEFIGVDPSFEPDTSIVHNRSGEIVNPILRWTWKNSAELRSWIAPILPLSMRGRFFRLIARGKRSSPRERLDPELRARLTEEIRDNILKTQELIGRELSHWL